MDELNRDILIIGSNLSAIGTMRPALEHAGFAVREATDGKTGLEQIIEARPGLVILDLWLGDASGFDFLAQLHALENGATIPIVAVTGFIAKDDEKRIIAAQFTDYLFKPVDISLLLKTVRTHLGSANHRDSNIGRDRRILVIDDQPSQLKLFSLHLRQLGFSVDTATNGVEGLAVARKQAPAAIVSDVLMPGIDGFQMCMQVRADPELANTPVVLLSNNYAQEADKQLAHSVGANALVQTAPDFVDAVQALLESLEAPAPRPIDDAAALSAAHQERLARQLERQTDLNYDLARRCSAQTAQISVLGQIGEKFIGGSIDRDELHSELVTQYLNATGFSAGAILVAGERGRLSVSAQVGLAAPVSAALPKFFDSGGLFTEIMSQGESLCITPVSSPNDRSHELLSLLDAQTILISPLRFGDQELGLMLVSSRVVLGVSDWLDFAKAITHEITQVMALNDSMTRLRYLASYDTLTGLGNRAYLNSELQKAAAAGCTGTLYLLNIDGFQEINNTLSFLNGNILLQQVAARLRANVPSGATIARLGADEFAIWRTDTASTEAIHGAAREMLKSLEPTFRLAGLPIALRATVGIAVMTDEAEAVLSCADMARRAAKRTGRDYLIYPENVEAYRPDNLVLLGELRDAVENGHLTLNYQPKASFKTGEVVGVEALLRWFHPGRSWVSPVVFIPLAERAGLIHPITLWVVETVLRQASAWRAAGWQFGVAVNISTHDLQDLAFPDFVADTCRSTGMPHSDLTLELTEQSLMVDPVRARNTLDRLSEMGFGISIDDFGTGYSSLTYLQNLPVSEIKIDKSFILDFGADARSAAIVRSIIDLGRNLGVKVVAEGIETQQSWNMLHHLGCNLAQGYYLCRPKTASELVAWLTEARQQASATTVMTPQSTHLTSENDERG